MLGGAIVHVRFVALDQFTIGRKETEMVVLTKCSKEERVHQHHKNTGSSITLKHQACHLCL